MSKLQKIESYNNYNGEKFNVQNEDLNKKIEFRHNFKISEEVQRSLEDLQEKIKIDEFQQVTTNIENNNSVITKAETINSEIASLCKNVIFRIHKISQDVKDTERPHSTIISAEPKINSEHFSKYFNFAHLKSQSTHYLTQSSSSKTSIEWKMGGNYRTIIEEPESLSLINKHYFKLLVVGDSNVGKTAVMSRFCNGFFMENYTETVGIEFQIKTILLNSRPYILRFLDTAGDVRFRPLITSSLRNVDGLIFIYNVMNANSLESIHYWLANFSQADVHKQAEQLKFPFPIMILANKIDHMRPSSFIVNGSVNETMRCHPSYRSGLQLALELDALFYPISAKTGININIAFENFARKIQGIEESESKKSTEQNKLQIKGKKSFCTCCFY